MVDNPDNPVNHRLIKLHERLEPHWSDFLYHRQRFIAALKIGFDSSPNPDNELIVTKIGKHAMDKKKILERANEADKRVFYAAFKTSSPLDTKKRKRRFHNERERAYKNPMRRASTINWAVAHHFDEFFSNLKKQDSDAYRKVQLVYDTANHKLHYFPNSGTSYLINGSTIAYFAPSGELLIHKGKAKAVFDISSGYPVKIEGFRFPEYSLSPLIVWAKSESGQRRYFPTVVPFPASDYAAPQGDTLVGLLAALQMSPEIMARLPKEMGLPGSGEFKQPMLEAQIPLLALLMQDKILQAPLFGQIEKYAGDELRDSYHAANSTGLGQTLIQRLYRLVEFS